MSHLLVAIFLWFSLSVLVSAQTSTGVSTPYHTQPRHIGRPQPLPPEGGAVVHNERSNQHHSRAIAASNLTLPQPPSPPPTSPPSPAPTPMDLAITYDLSQSCMTYLTSFLTSTIFTSCLPFSLLLTTSTSYGQLLSQSLSSGNLSAINRLIAYSSSPQPSSAQCDDYFSGVLSAMTAEGNCANDLEASSGIAKEAQAGIGSYKAVREASALVNPDTGVYCYLEAVASPKPDDLYLWSIPASISPPPTFVPTCSKCSSLLLDQFSASLDTTSSLNGTVVNNAIDRVNIACGPAFATSTAAETQQTGAASRTATYSCGIYALVATVLALSVSLLC